MWISEQTAIISLYNINWLVCITETECVYCAVRTVALYTIRVNVNQKHSAGVRCSALHISCSVPKSNIGTCNNSFPCPSQQLQITPSGSVWAPYLRLTTYITVVSFCCSKAGRQLSDAIYVLFCLSMYPAPFYFACEAARQEGGEFISHTHSRMLRLWELRRFREPIISCLGVGVKSGKQETLRRQIVMSLCKMQHRCGGSHTKFGTKSKFARSFYNFSRI